jgi:hypothetical protein
MVVDTIEDSENYRRKTSYFGLFKEGKLSETIEYLKRITIQQKNKRSKKSIFV